MHPRLMTGPPERSHIFSGIRSSTEAVIQACAYNACTSIRCRYSELNCSYTFAYFSYRVTQSVNEVLYPHPEHEDDNQSYRMSELIRAQDVSYRCLTSELNETRKCLGDMTAELEHLRNRHSYPSIETRAPFVFTPTDLLPKIDLHPVLRGERYPIIPSRNRYASPSD